MALTQTGGHIIRSTHPS